MNRSRAAPVLIALLSISALGVASTTLETSLTTDPDEEIDPDWDRLPIGQGDAATVLEEIGDLDEDEGDGESQTDEESDVDPEEDADDQATDGSGVGEAAEVADGGESADGTGDGDDDGDVEGEAGTDEGGDGGLGSLSGMGPDPGEWTLLDRVLAVLASLLSLVVALTVGALAYRYRERLLSLLDSEATTETKPAAAPETYAWPGTIPSNAVDEAWVTLVRRLDPKRPETTTAAECRALARDLGLEAEAVEPIATAFERVHYGGVDAVEEEDRAREGLSRLDAGRPVEDRRGVDE